jgi:CHAD domain-containing protein
LSIPRVRENAIPAKKLEMRYNKVVVRLRERIELDLPIVLTNVNKIEELHELRKPCKKLRYLLELTSHQQNGINNKETNAVITELEDVQDILGSIHDSDTTIASRSRFSMLAACLYLACRELLEGIDEDRVMLAINEG